MPQRRLLDQHSEPSYERSTWNIHECTGDECTGDALYFLVPDETSTYQGTTLFCSTWNVRSPSLPNHGYFGGAFDNLSTSRGTNVGSRQPSMERKCST